MSGFVATAEKIRTVPSTWLVGVREVYDDFNDCARISNRLHHKYHDNLYDNLQHGG